MGQVPGTLGGGCHPNTEGLHSGGWRGSISRPPLVSSPSPSQGTSFLALRTCGPLHPAQASWEELPAEALLRFLFTSLDPSNLPRAEKEQACRGTQQALTTAALSRASLTPRLHIKCSRNEAASNSGHSSAAGTLTDPRVCAGEDTVGLPREGLLWVWLSRPRALAAPGTSAWAMAGPPGNPSDPNGDIGQVEGGVLV